MAEIDYSQFEPAFKAESVEQPKPDEGIQPDTPPADVLKPTEVTTTDPPKPTEPVQTDYISSLNTKFNTSFKSDDDLKSVIETASKAQALQEQLKEFETLKSDIEYYKSGVNPLDYFSNEDAYRVEQFKKTNPDKDPFIAAKLFSLDLNKANDLDLLVQFELLGGMADSEADARILLENKYGIESDSEPKDWTNLTKAQVKRDAIIARREVGDLKSSIKLPDKIDLASKREAEQTALAQKAELLKKGWSDVVPKMMTDLKEVAITDTDKDGKEEVLIKYAIDDESKKQMGEEVMDYLISNHKEITEENIKEAAVGIQQQYALRNFAKILKAYHTTLATELDRKKDEETHNPNPPKTEVKPPTDVEADKQKLIEYATGGAKFPSKPLMT